MGPVFSGSYGASRSPHSGCEDSQNFHWVTGGGHDPMAMASSHDHGAEGLSVSRGLVWFGCGGGNDWVGGFDPGRRI